MREDPGLHVTELAERTSLSWHTAAYHVDILRRTGQVTVERDGRDRCVFPKGVPPRQRKALKALRGPEAIHVLQALLDSPRLNVPGLARRTGLSEKVVRRQLAKLAQAGLLNRIGTWHPVYEVRGFVLSSVLPRLVWAPGLRVGTWDWDPVARRSTMSDDAWRILGVPPERRGTCKEFIREFVHPDDQPGLKAAVEGAITEGKPFEHTVRVQTPSGERRIRQRGWVSVRTADGKPLRYVGTIQEVTDRHPSPDKARPQDWQPVESKRPGHHHLARGLKDGPVWTTGLALAVVQVAAKILWFAYHET